MTHRSHSLHAESPITEPVEGSYTIHDLARDVQFWLDRFERGPLPREEHAMFQEWLNEGPGRRDTLDALTMFRKAVR